MPALNPTLSAYLSAPSGGVLSTVYGMTRTHRRIVAGRLLAAVALNVATRVNPEMAKLATDEDKAAAAYPILQQIRSANKSTFQLIKVKCESGHPPEYPGAVGLFLVPDWDAPGLSRPVINELREIYKAQVEDNAYMGTQFDTMTRTGAAYKEKMTALKALRAQYKIPGYSERDAAVNRAAHARESSPSNRLDRLDGVLAKMGAELASCNAELADQKAQAKALRGLVKQIAEHVGLLKKAQ